MTDKQHAAVRKKLEERLEVLNAKIREIDHDLREPGDADFEENAIEREGDEVLEGLGAAGVIEINHIKHALERIENGTYGECEMCGGDIAPKRLEALPYTSVCIDCASRA
jgi:RNA polymerase-binding transcription factor DksA